MKILIIGGGNVAEELLSRIDLRKHEVFVVEKDPERRRVLSMKYDIYVIDRDATDVGLYTNEINMSEIDAVIALTGRNEINLFALAIAKMYNIPLRMAKVTDINIAILLQNLGLGIPICQPSLVASLISNYISAISAPLAVGEFAGYKLYYVSLAETDLAVNQRISQLNLPKDTYILLLFDGSNLRTPSPEDVLKPGYQLLVISKEPDVSKYFKG